MLITQAALIRLSWVLRSRGKGGVGGGRGLGLMEAEDLPVAMTWVRKTRKGDP